jgi:hypothetical protein
MSRHAFMVAKYRLRVSLLRQVRSPHGVPARLRNPPRAVEEAVENPFFNDSFKSVLAGALSRQDDEPVNGSADTSGYPSSSYSPSPYSAFASAEEEEA